MSIALSDGNYSLTSNNGAVDEARMAHIDFTGALTATRVITIPSKPKGYILQNSTTGGNDLTIDAGGTTATLLNGEWNIFWCDGTDVFALQAASGTVDTSGTPVANDYARFTDADTIEGRSYAEVRTDLGLVIGTNVQAWDADLDSLAGVSDVSHLTDIGGLTISNGDILYVSGGVITRLAVGSNDEVLTVASGAPSWAAAAGGGGVDVQAFTSSGTWTKPGSGTIVEVWVVGGGGGGGSGRHGSSGVERTGGGGGSGAGISTQTFAIGDLSATETVTIGAGGSGGAAQATVDTDGNNGSAGGATSFGSKLWADGGDNGNGGRTSFGVNGAQDSTFGNQGRWVGDGGRGEGGGSPIEAELVGWWGEIEGGTERKVLSGGGGGGGCSAANAEVAGADVPYHPFLTDGSEDNVSGGTTGGGNGNTGVQIGIIMATGGSGGGGNASGAGGTGGTGARGGGGGGGGGSTAANSGAGGDGGDGYCIVITY